MNRRKFLRAAASAAAGGAAGCGTSKSPFRFLSLEQARTLEAICACVIPGDADAGAVQAGVVHYIDRQLTRHFREHQKIYWDGLEAAVQADFANLGRDEQISLLHKVEQDPKARPFFNLVVTHAMQGFYGNPRHGGNREFASW